MKKMKIESDMMIRRGEVYKFCVSRKETEGTKQQKIAPPLLSKEAKCNSIRFFLPLPSRKERKMSLLFS